MNRDISIYVKDILENMERAVRFVEERTYDEFVNDDSLPRYKRSIPIYKELAGILIPKDLLVYTEDEIEEWSEVPQSFITTIYKKGRVIYEKDKD